MAVDPNSEEGREIRKCIPLNKIPRPHFEKLCKYLTLEKQAKDYQLFELGDETDDLIFLIGGEVALKAKDFNIETITANSDLAKFALAHQMPRKIGAVANSEISFLRIPPKVIKKLQESSSNVDHSKMVIEHEEDTSGDWMTRLLKSPIFQLVPAANLQKTLISLKEIEVKAGHPIVQQGDYPGDFYYIIKKGSCTLSRKPTKNAKDIKLGKLNTGDSFGEAAILADKPRELTITAEIDTTLLKLDKEHFLRLIRDPSLTFINPTTIVQELENGAMLIDIRAPDAFKEYHIDNSINIPYFSLRMTAKTLEQNKKIMLICADGKLSEAAAFNLIRCKLTVAIVEGGLEKARPLVQRYKANFVIDDHEPDEIAQPNDQLITEEDLAEPIVELESESVELSLALEEPSVDEEVIEYEMLSAALDDKENLTDNVAEDSFSLNVQAKTMLEAKIQLLRDENRDLMKTNITLEVQYADLLKQKETLEFNIGLVRHSILASKA